MNFLRKVEYPDGKDAKFEDIKVMGKVKGKKRQKLWKEIKRKEEE